MTRIIIEFYYNIYLNVVDEGNPSKYNCIQLFGNEFTDRLGSGPSDPLCYKELNTRIIIILVPVFL